MDGKEKVQKAHRKKNSGPKAEKKKLRRQGPSTEEDARKRNPKAFAVKSAVRMARTFHRSVSYITTRVLDRHVIALELNVRTMNS